MANRKKSVEERKAQESLGGKNLEKFADNQNRYDEMHIALKKFTDKPQFPGAYKENTNVLVLMRDSKSWKLAEIYKVKKAKFFDTPIRSADCDIEQHEDFSKTHLDQFIERLLSANLIT